MKNDLSTLCGPWLGLYIAFTARRYDARLLRSVPVNKPSLILTWPGPPSVQGLGLLTEENPAVVHSDTHVK